jgi:thioredoxin reductase (NADPH)
MSDAKIHDLIIIGSGPAGYTAAIYAARANLKPLLFTGMGDGGLQPGGQLMITTDVENYPGFPEGIHGPELMERFRDQAIRFGTEVVYENVDQVDFSKRPFKLVSAGTTYLARTVIISTGARARLLGLANEKRLMGFGVSACATCDGAFFKQKDVCIVGGGDSALEEANFLTRFATKVHVIHRRDALRASKIMQDRAMNNPKIDFVWNSEVVDVLDNGGNPPKVRAVVLADTRTGARSERATDGLFVAIGHIPNTDLFQGQLDLDDKGYLKVKPGTPETKIPGVFAAGDVADSVWRQAVTAAGTGCQAALAAERFLEAEGH